MENILLTGGTGNLGQTVVKVLADGGYHVHLAVRKDAAGGGNVSYYPTELTDSAQAGAFVQNVINVGKNIRAGVFLAGGFAAGNLAKTSMEDIQSMIQVNFATAFNTAQELIAYYKTVGGGKLIFVGSKAAMDFKGAGNMLAYSLSKQLLYNFSTLINESEKASGVTSHILLPGTIDTETNRGFMPNADVSKWIKPEAIAGVIKDIVSGKETRAVIEF
ncbi:SDR family NAD(P)-dependent oxidoreductase [Parachryseolinea silvisoli]|uniref:SDR family NAD(P)-dependent oxidoreductase n=1 Tax=Parachryseolinea silvisoli TaxID=2873601 RepID=UPI00226589B1|nr:SDR family NAD(P)-dependent oxidoreductase [Parachryseolinea silvisoli]MCD9017120.1 SDR family NAD(P)-dependent oxidoreductase [Parachryseolinea silvisoli]